MPRQAPAAGWRRRAERRWGCLGLRACSRRCRVLAVGVAVRGGRRPSRSDARRAPLGGCVGRGKDRPCGLRSGRSDGEREVGRVVVLDGAVGLALGEAHGLLDGLDPVEPVEPPRHVRRLMCPGFAGAVHRRRRRPWNPYPNRSAGRSTGSRSTSRSGPTTRPWCRCPAAASSSAGHAGGSRDHVAPSPPGRRPATNGRRGVCAPW